jgi:hypothetical protein
MSRYTEEENRRRSLMRRQEMADDARRKTMWNAAGVGFSETETEYGIEYRRDADPAWYSADPFYEPLRLHTDLTHSREEALVVAEEIRAGRWGVTKQSGPGTYNITGVRVYERVSSAKIIHQLS